MTAGNTPHVSVVIGCHQDGRELSTTLDSIADQHDAPDWECLIVANGPFQAGEALKQRLVSDPRFRLLHSFRPGLTEALSIGCSQARGTFIARLDVGDVMVPQRLARQVLALGDDPDVVLCTSAVFVCGPSWEPLWVNRGTEALTGVPIRVDQLPASEGLSMDIPHHASVMFRRSAYQVVGGYRSQFYFGQDWDLWYRLAGAGSFVSLAEALTRVRLFSDGLSSRNWREQREIARLSLACYQARSKGISESHLLQQAAAVRPRPRVKRRLPWDSRRAEGAYFIAEALRRNRDRRCLRYFIEALSNGFWKPRIWIRSIQAISCM
jgi:glycosyltransferase involved in cell wall biosynthesis